MSAPRTVSRALYAARTLHQTGLLVPVAGLAVMAVSARALTAMAGAFPEAAALGDLPGSCDPLDADFGCGHGFGCACHLLPSDFADTPPA